jgi:hypothetical protein
MALLFSLSVAVLARDPVDIVTTTDGQAFKNVTVLKVKGDKALVNCADGGAWIPLASLSDETRKALGLRTRAEQTAFETAQAQKGLIKVGDEWITPEEKKAREDKALADQKAEKERLAREAEIARQRAAFEARLTELVPDWREIAAKPGFNEWLKGRTPDSSIAKTNITYAMVLEEAVKNGNAGRAAWVYREWRSNELGLIQAGQTGVPARGGY